MSPVKDVLLVGFGGVGAVYSLILKKSGLARVTVVARSNYEAIKEAGVHFKSQKYGNIQGWTPDRVFSSIAEAADRPYSHVVVTTKAIPEMQTTPELLKPFLTPPYTDTYPQPTYVLMQNGLNLERDLYNAAKALDKGEEPRILNTAVYVGTRLEGKNVVIHNDFDRVSLGIYRTTPNIMTNSSIEESILSEFGDMLKLGGTELTIVPEIQRIKFLKNMWNCIFGPIAALSQNTPSAIFRPPETPNEGTTRVSDAKELETGTLDDPSDLPFSHPLIGQHTIPFIKDVFKELITLGNAIFPSTPDGPGLDPRFTFNTLKTTAHIFSKPTSIERPSMLVDVELGRPMELEVVVGEVVRLGKKHRISMPRVETFYALLLVLQTQFLRARARM